MLFTLKIIWRKILNNSCLHRTYNNNNKIMFKKNFERSEGGPSSLAAKKRVLINGLSLTLLSLSCRERSDAVNKVSNLTQIYCLLRFRRENLYSAFSATVKTVSYL